LQDSYPDLFHYDKYQFWKADPEKQLEFAKNLKELENKHSPRSVTVYVDEGQARRRKFYFMLPLCDLWGKLSP